VTRGTTASLQSGTQHGIADVVADVQRWAERFGLLGLQPFVVDTVAAIGMHVAFDDLDVMHGVREHHDAALREHDVIVQFLRQTFPFLDRVVVECGAFIEEIIRADDGGIAAGVAAADPALFEYGDIGQPVLFRQIIGGTQTMAAAADDDGVIGGLRFRLTPLLLPT
jgi:hypothetical protein